MEKVHIITIWSHLRKKNILMGFTHFFLVMIYM
jgi:hypothetical protein